MTKEVKNNSKMGRPKGSLNARTVDLLEIAHKHKCNPFEILIMFANGDYESLGYEQKKLIITKDSSVEEYTISPELRQRSAKDACEYLFPKRKSVEHTLNTDGMEDDEVIQETARMLSELLGNK